MELTQDELNKLMESLGKTAEEKSARTERMVKDVLKNHPSLDDYKYEVYTKGSYQSDIGVDGDSDVDIAIVITEFFRAKYPPSKTKGDFNNEPYLGNLSFAEFKRTILKALQEKFGVSNVEDRGKCFRVRENTSTRVQADICPSQLYKDYTVGKPPPLEGTLLTDKLGNDIINFPKKDAENIRAKDSLTKGRYKKIIRLTKRVRNKLNLNLSSYLIVGIFNSVFYKEYLEYDYTWVSYILKKAISNCESSIAYSLKEVNEVNPLFIQNDSKKNPVNAAKELKRILKYIEEGV